MQMQLIVGVISVPDKSAEACKPKDVIHPELLEAASRGHYNELVRILSPGKNEAAAEHTIDLPREATSGALCGGKLGSWSQSTRAVEGQPLPSLPATLLTGVTFQGDSALHVVVASGDGRASKKEDGRASKKEDGRTSEKKDDPDFIKCADLIYQEAKHLLDSPNNKDDTPLHCAARAGHGEVLSRLIALAKQEGGDERVEEVLTKSNKLGETVLHEAVRFGDKKLVSDLVSACRSLVRFPLEGTSALYLAISLGHESIVDELLNSKDPGPSYSGPAGQNALHAASLHGGGMYVPQVISQCSCRYILPVP
jgi:ankyrin repeat protein